MILLLVAVALLALEVIISMLKSVDEDSDRTPPPDRARDESNRPEPGYAKNTRTAPGRPAYGLVGQERGRSPLPQI
jgi:hypothetical protein